MVPLDPVPPTDAKPSTGDDPNGLFDSLAARLRTVPLQWRMVITVAKPGDPTNDASQLWPDDRERIDVGTLTVDHIDPAGTGPCCDLNFDPLVLPYGIEPSDDPLLSAFEYLFAVIYSPNCRKVITGAAPTAVEWQEDK